MRETDAIKAADAAQTAYDAAVKLLCFIGNEEREGMYEPVLAKAVEECAEALGYTVVKFR